MAGHRILSVETLHEGWGKLLLLRIELPDRHVLKREVEDHGAAVAVLPYDPERRLAVLVRQFRAPAFHAAGKADVLEAPAGMLDEGDPEACARREAGEEVGLALGALERVGAVWTMPGVSTERIHLFLARYSQADKIGAGGGLAEEHENTVVVETSLPELGRMAERGELADLKTLALVQALRLRRPELFGPVGATGGTS
ncbi:MAG TPA: NUDIX hydrolase [Beijerinckiaceae bacterium]|nr:NUDIX hydrolase [Beijerinckiaceae bacterium]